MNDVTDDVPQAAQWQQAAPPQQTTTTRRRWLWPAVVGGWALLLLILGVWSAFNSPATVRDQTTLTSAKTTMDRVVGQVDGRLPDGWKINDQGYEQSTCELSVARDGATVIRTLTASGPSGTEAATLSEIATGLVGSRVRPTPGPAESFFFDAGDYVSVQGKITGSGTMVIELNSGCRIPS